MPAPLRFTKPILLRNVTSPFFYSYVDFYFDLNDAGLDAFQLSGVSELYFMGCTFNFLSPARCVFGGYDSTNRQGKASVVIYPDCKLIGNGFLTGQDRNGKRYWRANLKAPSQYTGVGIWSGYTIPPIDIRSPRWPVLPTNTLWDGDIDLHLEEPDADGYLSAHVTTPGWIGATVPSWATPAVIKRYNHLVA